MSDQLRETAGLILEVETLDSTLSSHTSPRIVYIPPTAAGKEGDIANKVEVAGTAVAGLRGNSVMQSPPIILIPGPYKYWSASTNPGGVPRLSPVLLLFVDALDVARFP